MKLNCRLKELEITKKNHLRCMVNWIKGYITTSKLSDILNMRVTNVADFWRR